MAVLGWIAPQSKVRRRGVWWWRRACYAADVHDEVGCRKPDWLTEWSRIAHARALSLLEYRLILGVLVAVQDWIRRGPSVDHANTEKARTQWFTLTVQTVA